MKTESLMTITKRTGLVALTVALAGITACSQKSTPADAGLKNDLAAAAGGGGAGDLELAPKRAQSQMIVSAIEGGPSAAPAPAAPKVAPKPTPRPTPPRPTPHVEPQHE